MLIKLIGWLRKRLFKKEKSDEDTGSVWDPIPSWQYGGRFDGAAITRGQQEDAIEEVGEEAEKIEAEIEKTR